MSYMILDLNVFFCSCFIVPAMQTLGEIGVGSMDKVGKLEISSRK
jgi:hypothetical protein